MMCRAIKSSVNREENEPFGVTRKRRCVAPFLRTGVKYRGARGRPRALYAAASAATAQQLIQWGDYTIGHEKNPVLLIKFANTVSGGIQRHGCTR